MAHYLLQLGYTPEAWAALLTDPQDRSKAVEGAIAKLGDSAFHCFGTVLRIGQQSCPGFGRITKLQKVVCHVWALRYLSLLRKNKSGDRTTVLWSTIIKGKANV